LEIMSRRHRKRYGDFGRRKNECQFWAAANFDQLKMLIVSPSQSQTWQDNGIFRTSSSFGDTNHTSRWVCSRVLVLPCRVLDVLMISAMPGTSRTEDFYHHWRSFFWNIWNDGRNRLSILIHLSFSSSERNIRWWPQQPFQWKSTQLRLSLWLWISYSLKWNVPLYVNSFNPTLLRFWITTQLRPIISHGHFSDRNPFIAKVAC
jgi:hypothetical protein